MPIPEGYLPRKGDVVVVHAVVKYDVNPTEDADSEEGLQVWVTPMEYHSPSRVPLKTLVGLYSRRFDEGEAVRLIGLPETRGEVVAISGSSVWVKFSEDSFATYQARDLEPIPDAVEEPPVDVSDIPEAPKMRFAVGQEVTIARLGDDAVRMEQISRFVGCSAKIFAISDDLYKVSITGGGYFFASDDMLDPREEI